MPAARPEAQPSWPVAPRQSSGPTTPGNHPEPSSTQAPERKIPKQWASPKGRHLTIEAKAEINQQYQDPKVSQRDLARTFGVSPETIGHVLGRTKRAAERADNKRKRQDEAGVDPQALSHALQLAVDRLEAIKDGDAPAPLDGIRTPRGLHVTALGKALVLKMSVGDDRMHEADVASALGLSRTSVWAITEKNAAEEAPPGMKAPGGHLTPAGKQEILRRHELNPRQPLIAIAHALGLAHATVKKTIDQHRVQTAAASSSTSRRPIVALDDWSEVGERGWNAGDRFSVPTDGVPRFYEFIKSHQPGEKFSLSEVWPKIMGG
jgi:transposase-like protein